MPKEITQPKLATYENKPYFWVDTPGSGVVFYAPANGATTSGSLNPRSELREMKGGGKEPAAWNGAKGNHYMEITQAITQRPTRSDGMDPVVAGQVHGGTDDVTACRLHGNDIRATHGDDITGPGTLTLINNYVLGTIFVLLMHAHAGGIDYYINGVYKGQIEWPGSKKGNYFKAGAYCQANPSNGGAGAAQVKIYDLRIDHTA